jgi:hypothetical protein
MAGLVQGLGADVANFDGVLVGAEDGEQVAELFPLGVPREQNVGVGQVSEDVREVEDELGMVSDQTHRGMLDVQAVRDHAGPGFERCATQMVNPLS